MPPKKSSIGRTTRNAIKLRRQRQNESNDESQERRAANRIRQRKRRDKETEQQKQKRRNVNRARIREQRAMKKAKERKRQNTKTHSVLSSLPTQTQMPVQKHLRAVPPAQPASMQKKVLTAPPPVPAQQTPRHVQVAPVHRVAPPRVQPTPKQVLAARVPVSVAKRKPKENLRPKERQIFVVADHHRAVLFNLASLWKSEKLCDAGIGNGSSTVMVHKLILFVVCPKLLSVTNMDIKFHEFLQLNFPKEVSEEALNAFAEYMYNGILILDPDILEQLKIIARRLDMTEFEQLCDSHLSNHIHQPASSSFTNVPLIQTMQIPAMTSSSSCSFGSTNFTQSTTPVIDNQQKIFVAEVQKKPAAVFSQQSDVLASLGPHKSEDAGFVINPSVKIEPIGPEDDQQSDHWRSRSNNCHQNFTSTITSVQSAPFITTRVNDIKKEITKAELNQVKKEPSDVSSLTPNISEHLITPSIKKEPVGPEDSKYGHWSVSSCNQTITSNSPSSSFSSTTAAPTAASSSITPSSTEFAILVSEATKKAKFITLKAVCSSEAPPLSDLSPASNVVKTVYSQSLQLGSETENSHKQLAQTSDSQPTVNLPKKNRQNMRCESNSVNENSSKMLGQTSNPITFYFKGR